VKKQVRVKGQTDIAPPWEPAEATLAEINAIKALIVGKASEYQQGLIVGWLERATGVTSLEFRPDSDRASSFASGKRFVGLQFFQLAKAVLAQPAAPKQETRQP
jgi:hypothetical protein